MTMDDKQDVTGVSKVRRPPGRPRKQVADPVRESVRERGGGLVVQGRDGEILTRSRKEGIDPFDVPLKFIPRGWEYQWNAVSSYGNKEIFQSVNNEMLQNGWRPVPAQRHDGHYMPRGHAGDIVVRGQMLMERPKALCDEARDEHENRARQQMRDRDDALLGGRTNVRQAMRGGFEMGGQYRGTGGSLKMSIDPALDIPKPSYDVADE
jgi:hypothetical protein